MSTKIKPNFLIMLLSLVALAGLHAQGTAFTYQGRVTDNGTNFTGPAQFEFALVTSTNSSHQATATADMGGTSPNEFVNGYTIISGGSGYVTAPAVTVSAPGGGGTTATATTTITGGTVTSINIISPGSGYSSTPTVTIAPPPSNISYTTYWSNDGTSVAGSEPTAAVNVVVNNGLFTIVLGDTTLANMTALDASIFQQPDLQLRIWFNDGVNGFATLNPPQYLTPAPYAITATSAGNLLGTLPVAQLSGSVDNTQLANSSVTVNAGTGLSGGGAIALGGSTTLNNAGVTSLTGSEGVTVSASNGAVTLGSTAASANAANSIVSRDGSGNFAAGSITLAGSLKLPSPATTIYSGSDLLLLSDTNNANFFAGAGAGNLTTSGPYNTAIGYEALHANTNGSLNTATGCEALYANTSGADNTAFGYAALYGNTNGSFNTAIGFQPLSYNTSGSNNVANGADALFFNRSGSFNTANGTYALYSNTTGSENTANGISALAYNTSGSFNTAIGAGALFSNTSGTNNIALGTSAGDNITTGNNDIDIGNQGDVADTGIIRIGDTQTKTYLVGTVYANGVALTSDRNAKENFTSVDVRQVLAKVAALPITEWNYKTDAATQKHIGPMAQDFHAAFGVNGTDDKHISVIDEGGVALAAIQGLNDKVDVRSQRSEVRIQKLETENAELKARLDKIEALLRYRLNGGAR